MKQLFQYLTCVFLVLHFNTTNAQVTKITAPDFNVEDCFGWSVSINGNYAVIGNVYDDDNDIQSGSVYVYYFDGEAWVEQEKLIASDGGFADYFGYAVSVYDDQIVTGAYRDVVGSVRSGSAYVYQRNGDEWIETARLTPYDPEEEDRFGAKVDIHGNYAAVASYWDDDQGASSGAVYIYKKTENNWNFHQKLVPADLLANDLFGTSVFLNNNNLFVGAIGNSTYATNSGKVYVYDLVDGSWVLVQELYPEDPMTGQHFGQDISTTENYLIIGAYNDGEQGDKSGAVYVFEATNNGWIQSQKLLPDDGHAGAFFGNSVSIYQNNLLIASLYNITGHGESGSIYIYSLDDNNWIQTSKIVPSDGHNQQRFGADVGLWENNALCGAPYDEEMGYRCGAGYIFDLDIILYQDDKQPVSRQLTIFPNPSAGYTIFQSSGLQMPLVIEVLDMHGSVLRNFATDTPAINISTTGIPSGVYYIRVNSIDGSKITRKLVIL